MNNTKTTDKLQNNKTFTLQCGAGDKQKIAEKHTNHCKN